MDNVSAVQYINRLGVTRSKALGDLLKDFCHFCLAHQISVTAEYLPGTQNSLVDWNSRFLLDSSNWQLDPRVSGRLWLSGVLIRWTPLLPVGTPIFLSTSAGTRIRGRRRWMCFCRTGAHSGAAPVTLFSGPSPNDKGGVAEDEERVGGDARVAFK
ncbi:hypothetical protein NDU88_001261 [Pleurodeles waltl]|uniref:Uncharacterized protein n=1 Tax=Pleurodeles waltl TaxID=8319 RepID=A0AAV7U7M1_PLEWA|nr:hypothetical protein NDU88_001261 [Pleurodeles waltl]